MAKLTEGLHVFRYDIPDECPLTTEEDGVFVFYDSMQHHYKECLEHGNTLEEAIKLMEEKNGP